MKKVTLIFVVGALMISTNLFAQRTSDVEGSKDYPSISRFQGSFIEYYKIFKTGEYKIPVNFKTAKFTYEYPAIINGEIYRIQYSVSSDNNPTFVVKALKESLSKDGFKIIYSGDNKAMRISPTAFNKLFYEKLGNGNYGLAYGTKGEDQALILAQKGNTYTLMYISWFSNATLITEDVIEAKSFTQETDKPEIVNLISPFEGSVLGYYHKVKWDKYIMPISKISKNWEKLELKGEITRIQYMTNSDNNAAFVYENYLDAFKKANWEILFGGSGDDELGNSSYEWQYGMFQEGLKMNKFGDKYGFRGGNYAYLVTEFEKDNELYYVALYIVEQKSGTLINEDVIKVKKPDVGLVTVDLLTQKINQNGHIALDGIYFETGKATLTENSAVALQNISGYLNTHKDKKYFIVGHTDNVGDFSANMSLSENRAKAVMNELISKYAVDANQLNAYGDANLSPVLSNKTDEGKAKNRRVEIVEQ